MILLQNLLFFILNATSRRSCGPPTYIHDAYHQAAYLAAAVAQHGTSNHMLEPNSHPTMFYSCIHQRQPMYLGMRQSFFFQTRAPKVFPMSFFFHTAKSLCVSPALTCQTQAPTVVSIWRCSMGYLGLAHPLASLLLDIQTESHQLGFNGHYDFRRLIAEAAYIEAIPNTVGREISEGV